jgi:hypothetical protein
MIHAERFIMGIIITMSLFGVSIILANIAVLLVPLLILITLFVI